MDQKNSELAQISKWQYKLLPTIIRIIIFLTVFFFLASLMQLIYLQTRIDKVPEIDKNWVKATIHDNQLYQLEYLTIQNRYHQGNTSLMSRIWLQYLGFITGMILAIIGAIFILGKLREPETKIDLDASQVKFSILSASPGLVMVFLGTFIMITTIVVHNEIEIKDASVYVTTPMNNIGRPWAEVTTVPSPDSLGNPEKKGDADEKPPK
jgi:hypothetical protein